MTDQTPPPVPQQAAGWYPDPEMPGAQRYWTGLEWSEHRQPAGGPPAKKKSNAKWIIPLVACLGLAFVAVVIGALAGSSEDEGEENATVATTEASETTEAPTTEAPATEAPTTEAPETTAAPTTAAPTTETPPAPDTFTAGDYTFADVQVSEDFVNDFEVRARVTNNGSTKDSVAVTVTIFSGGSVVGTADGFADSFEAGSTITMEFISTDDFTEWDEVEFQVEFEY